MAGGASLRLREVLHERPGCTAMMALQRLQFRNGLVTHQPLWPLLAVSRSSVVQEAILLQGAKGWISPLFHRLAPEAHTERLKLVLHLGGALLPSGPEQRKW